MKAPWQQSVDEIIISFGTDPVKGLSSATAAERLKTYGPNVLPQEKRLSVATLLLNQFNNYMMWLLAGACIIAYASGLVIDAVTIFVIMLFNAILGFFQEYKAERSLAALRNLMKPFSQVLRDGIPHKIPSEQLVPGDCVLIESGDLVTADGRIIECAHLMVQESALTGESGSISKIKDPLLEKELLIGDRINMVFMGTSTVSGTGKFIVTATGMHTELGKIAHTLQILPEEETVLETKIKRLGNWLLGMCLVVIAAIFFMGMLTGESLKDLLFKSISIAVAAIPEGLPAIISVALARALTRMAKRHALIRRLAVVESLGSVTVICADKTGTLTQNEMVVTTLWTNNKLYTVTGKGYVPEGVFKEEGRSVTPQSDRDLSLLLTTAVLCNNAHLIKENQNWKIYGDPTEAALLTAAAKAGFKKSDLEKDYPLKAEFPFDPERKRMSMLRQHGDTTLLFVKGAPDSILKLCDNVPQHHLESIYHNLAQHGLRVLACAYRELADSVVHENLENHLTFVGFIAMVDPLRPETTIALATCKRAGIRTVMITGDHKETAKAIAHQLGLIEETSRMLDGSDLERMTDDQLKEHVHSVTVFTRVTPDHKLRIVSALRSHNEVVAMTGDGVNDAPALKAADVGIAMGSGTDIAKGSSDMIITDNNFASIVHAIEEGRGAYDNLIKCMSYLVSSNMAELLILFFASLFSFIGIQNMIAFTPLQILWINLISDGPPALALAFDPLHPHVMHRKPQPLTQPLITGKHTLELFLVAFLFALAVLFAGSPAFAYSLEHANTMALTTLIMLECVRAYMVRERTLPLLSNPWLITALIGSLLLQFMVLYTPLHKVFGLVPLEFTHWIIIISITACVWFFAKVLQHWF